MIAMSTAQIFEHHLRVPASDCTVGNHVYYSRYLDWLEAARNGFFRGISHPFPKLFESGIMLPAVEAQIQYHGAARFDDRVVVRLWLQEISRIKLVFAAEIVNMETGKVLVTVSTTHVFTDHNGKPHRLPAPLLQALQARVRTELV